MQDIDALWSTRDTRGVTEMTMHTTTFAERYYTISGHIPPCNAVKTSSTYRSHVCHTEPNPPP